MSWEDLINSSLGSVGTSSGGGGGSGGIVDASYVVEGLVKRGLPRFAAEAFAMNYQDESGLNPGINERNPLVKGSRGGYGLAQWTGPRRRAYETFAAQRGSKLDDVDTQLDFTIWELDNTEQRARDKILAAGNAGAAGAAVVNSFLRPAEEHRRRRAAKYSKGTYKPSAAPTYNKLWLELGD